MAEDPNSKAIIPAMPRGRANAFSRPFYRQAILVMAAKGYPVQMCFRANGTSDATVKKWQKMAEEDPGGEHARFLYEVAVAHEKGKSDLYGYILDAAKGAPDHRGIWKNDWKAAAHILKNVDPTNWGDKKQVDHTHTVEGPRPSRVDPKKLTLQELETLAGLLEKGNSPEAEEAIDVDFAETPEGSQ